MFSGSFKHKRAGRHNATRPNFIHSFSTEAGTVVAGAKNVKQRIILTNVEDHPAAHLALNNLRGEIKHILQRMRYGHGP